MKTTKTYHILNDKKIDKDSVIVDAGAFIGEFIEEMKGYGCKIFAIEASSQNFSEIRPSENVELFEGALIGDDREEVDFHSFGKRQERGSVKGIHPGENAIYKVKTIRLKDILNKYGKIDYLKMDIEGEEYDIINSLTKEDAEKIYQISMEVHDNINIKKLRKKLNELGYRTKEYPHKELYCSRIKSNNNKS